jgi:iron complex transport system permease protein
MRAPRAVTAEQEPADPPALRRPAAPGAAEPPVDDPLGERAHRRRAVAWSAALAVALVVTVVLACGIGPVPVEPATVLGVLRQHLAGGPAGSWSASDATIVWDVRLPRVVLGAAAGAGLAVAGAALQAVVRNVLADPYVLGLSGGASTGAAATILFGLGAGLGAAALPVAAFAGAFAASVLVVAVARAGGRVTTLRLLLAGVAVGYALSAATSVLIFLSDSAEGSRSVMFWQLGSLSLARRDALLAIVVVVVLGAVALLVAWGRRLDLMAAGDGTALALGLEPGRVRLQVLAVASLTTGVVVAASGAIGFVGLVVPHLARRLVGATHRRMLPVAALAGAVLLVWADVLARTVLAPREMPIGVITAVVGAPFLLVLVRRLHAPAA